MPHNPASESETEPQWLARAALEKAREHLAAADAIARLGNKPMAFSHVVLGLEEWAKQVLAEGEGLGLLEFGTPDESNPFKLSRRMLFSHRSKQLGAILLAALLLPMRGRLGLILDAEAADRQVSREELTARLKSDLEVSKQLIQQLDQLETMKEAGLYSGEVTQSGTKASPASTEDFERLRELLAEQLEIELFALEHPLTPEQIEEQRRLGVQLREQLRPYALKSLSGNRFRRQK